MTSPFDHHHRLLLRGWCWIAVVALLVYWPLSTFQYSMAPGDTYDCWLPWRWFISLCLFNGELPTWNPLQQMGYPIHADLQGPSWYIEAIALGGTVGHSMITLQALYLCYIIIGGAGIMHLAHTLHGDVRAGTIAGVAYALGGFFTTHQMHFYSVISGAWLPWLIDAQVRLIRAPRPLTAVRAAIFQGLLLTGGNHTFTIVAAYLIAALCLVAIVRNMRGRDHRYVLRLVKHQSLFIVIAGAIGVVTLYAWWEVSPFLARADGLPYEMASIGPFSMTCWRSFVMPFALPATDELLGTDPAMMNGYMGAIILVFALLAAWRRRGVEENVFAAFGGIALIAALGDATPLHHALWRWLPGLNVFRFPSYYLWFTFLAVLMLAAGSISAHATSQRTRRTPLLILLTLFGSITLLLAMLDPFDLPGDAPNKAASFYNSVRSIPLADRRWLCAAITLPCLLTLGGLAWSARLDHRWLFALVVLEMGWQTQWAQWLIAVRDVHPLAVEARMRSCPHGPVPLLPGPMANDRDGARILHLFWRNTQDLVGHPTHDGFNSFLLPHTHRLATDHTALARSMQQRPLAYFGGPVVPWERYAQDPSQVLMDSVPVVLPPGSTFAAEPSLHPGGSVAFERFNYHTISVRTDRTDAGFLVFQQSWFPGWRILIDGKEAPLQRVNVAAFGVAVPSGEHRVTAEFHKPALWPLLVLSLSVLAACMITLQWRSPRRPRWLYFAATAVLFASVVRSLTHERPVNADQAVRPDGPVALARTLLQEQEVIALTPERINGDHFTVPASMLTSEDARSLLLDLRYRSSSGAMNGSIVVERWAQGEMVDYEAIPLDRNAPLFEGWRRMRVMHDLREFRYDGEQVVIYPWLQGTDTLWIADQTIGVTRDSPLDRGW